TSCDAINLDGTAKDSSTVRSSYTHAQKMHASMTYVFGRMYGLGSLPWHYDNTQDLMVGNPSVSEKVSSYMVSLRRRKVQAGEVASSARAITPEIMGALYDHNHKPENWIIHPYAPGTRGSSSGDEGLHTWGGP
ncbi:hypothetical protein BYT27DRAFT_7072917, partial [Phlegmacium glaucopus]